MSKKLISLLILVMLVAGLLPAVGVAAPPPQEEGVVYTVQKDDWLSKLADRKNQRCKVLAKGKLNSWLIEFEDGHRVVTSRNAVRRACT